MSRIEINETKCKGCLLCTTVCPKSLLQVSTRINGQGYKVAELPEDRISACTGCASCAVMCPDTAIRVYRTAKGGAA